VLAGIQPIVVDEGHDIVDLLNEVSLALVYGGLLPSCRRRMRCVQTFPSTITMFQY
jgi:nitrogen fixation protein NifX